MSGRSSTPRPSRAVTESSCANLTFKTQIATPVATVVAKLNKGNVLDVTVASPTGPINLITGDGKLAGSLLSRNQAKLLNCISAGTVYVADVLNVNGAQCDISIRAK